MSELKPVYLLAGGRPRNARTFNPLFKEVFKESGKTNPRSGMSALQQRKQSLLFNDDCDA